MHGGTMVIQLEGDAEDIVALALEDTGHNRRIDATDMATTIRVSSGLLSKSSVFTFFPSSVITG